MQTLFINLIPTGRKEECYVKQFDIGRVIRLCLHENDVTKPYAFKDGDAVVINVKKTNSQTAVIELPISEGNTYVDWITTTEIDDVCGTNECELKLTTATAEIRTADFEMKIQAAKGDTPTVRKGGLFSTATSIVSTTYETE